LSDAAPDMSFDLIGVFNSLDHYLKPVELLRELLTISRFVYVEGHAKSDAGKQHPFLLNDDVFRKLPITGVSVMTQFSGAKDPETFSVLLRRES
jgi:hypothetical protein